LASASSLEAAILVGVAYNDNKPVFDVQAVVAGSAPPAYDQTAVIPEVNRVYGIGPADPSGDDYDGPSLAVHATNVKAEASSPGFGVDLISSSAGEQIDLAAATIYASPEDPSAPEPPDAIEIQSLVVGLQISASSISSDAFASHLFGGSRSFFNSTADFGSLSIGGPLLGQPDPVTFSGAADPNTVLVDNDSVVVTLNKQDLLDAYGRLVSDPTAASTILSEALDIHFKDQPAAGQPPGFFAGSLSGDIVIGVSVANIDLSTSSVGSS